MSFEQPAYSRSFNHPGGEPPTPTRTPTSPTFFSNSYQTPKQDSNFRDPLSPWTPARGFSPIFNSQIQAAYTPPKNDPAVNSASFGLKTSGDVDGTIASHALHPSSDHDISLAPEHPSPQLASSPQGRNLFDNQISNPASRRETTQPQTTSDKAATEGIHPAGSMQTPPPTSTSASRRRVSESQAARSRALASKGGKMSTFVDGNVENAASTDQRVEESPSTHFPNLQFSPDGFGFPMSTGPATAPVYPQHKLFWDPEQRVDSMNLDFPMDDTFTSFGMGLQKQLEPYVSDQQQSSGVPFPSTPAFTVAGTNHVNIANLTAPILSAALNRTNTSPSTAIMTQGSSRGCTAVNPSLLFSSPGDASLPVSQPLRNDSSKPYAHQLQDAVYEKELRSRRPKRKRGIEIDSPAVKAATQALRGAEDESSVDSADGNIIASFSGHGRPKSRHSRNASGQQRTTSTGQSSRQTFTEFDRRTSVTLTVDENGRAKTETKLVSNRGASTSNRVDLDGDSLDSDSSSSRSSQGMALSQPSSFAYPVGKQRKPSGPKLHRVFDGRTAHSHHSSYASTRGFTTTASINAGSIQSISDLQMISQPQVHFEDSTSFISRTLAGDDSEAETIVDTDEDKGNAASALKKVVRQRSNQKLRKNTMPRQSFADHRMPSSGSLPPYFHQNTVGPSGHGRTHHQQNISPTTVTDPDLATPSTSGRSASDNRTVTRCVCHNLDGDGQLMVQW